MSSAELLESDPDSVRHELVAPLSLDHLEFGGIFLGDLGSKGDSVSCGGLKVLGILDWH